MHHAVDELDGGFLFEAEAVADAVAGVDQDAKPQGQIAFGAELHDVLALFGFDHLEVVLDEVGDEAAFLVGHREQHVHAGDIHGDARGLVALGGGSGRVDGLLLGGPQAHGKGAGSPDGGPDFHTVSDYTVGFRAAIHRARSGGSGASTTSSWPVEGLWNRMRRAWRK